MRAIASRLEMLIDDYLAQLNNISEEQFSEKPSPVKWSRKEIIGHLIDSAQNNIRRFIVAQYEDDPAIVYNQDKWVALINYQHMDSSVVIKLWYLLNKQIISILQNTSVEASQRTSNSGELHTIEWLSEDYVKHMKHHIHHALGLEPVAYP